MDKTIPLTVVAFTTMAFAIMAITNTHAFTNTNMDFTNSYTYTDTQYQTPNTCKPIEYSVEEYCQLYPRDPVGCCIPQPSRRAFSPILIYTIVDQVVQVTTGKSLLEVVGSIAKRVLEEIGPMVATKVSSSLKSMFKTADELRANYKNVKYDNGSIYYEISGGTPQRT